MDYLHFLSSKREKTYSWEELQATWEALRGITMTRKSRRKGKAPAVQWEMAQRLAGQNQPWRVVLLHEGKGSFYELGGKGAEHCYIKYGKLGTDGRSTSTSYVQVMNKVKEKLAVGYKYDPGCAHTEESLRSQISGPWVGMSAQSGPKVIKELGFDYSIVIPTSEQLRLGLEFLVKAYEITKNELSEVLSHIKKLTGTTVEVTPSSEDEVALICMIPPELRIQEEMTTPQTVIHELLQSLAYAMAYESWVAVARSLYDVSLSEMPFDLYPVCYEGARAYRDQMLKVYRDAVECRKKMKEQCLGYLDVELKTGGGFRVNCKDTPIRYLHVMFAMVHIPVEAIEFILNGVFPVEQTTFSFPWTESWMNVELVPQMPDRRVLLGLEVGMKSEIKLEKAKTKKEMVEERITQAEW